MQRISVDLPEPDGPMTTTTSCLPTLMSTPCRAVNEPNRLTTPCRSIITSPVAGDLGGVGEDGARRSSASLIVSPLPAAAPGVGSRGSS